MTDHARNDDQDTEPRSARGDIRTAMAQERMAAVGIDEAAIERLVRTFYGKIMKDEVLGPIFGRAITDWEPHLRKMTDFWSSIALLTQRYEGRPMPVHITLGLEPPHFERWLGLFRETAKELFPADGAAFLIGKAENIARSFQMGIQFFTVPRKE
ncbi:group III truncated hemoglobin [Azospirillum picis]|uniref:Hemoglobin n=1 Tax=Azospirillum picis TaxID=488438 RepID=A0ABU0MFQ3_9PROT|nr:group III truncated hemoglobin [Azospirillum picis]MBP2298681.1 hemoglobin [Azospirillum picis]MDQ0532270.1 hemoglobin [Azospirillum picis]